MSRGFFKKGPFCLFYNQKVAPAEGIRIHPEGSRIPNAVKPLGHPALQMRTLHLEAESDKLADAKAPG